MYYAKRGDKGPIVKVLQRRLNEQMGTSIAVDGIFGIETQALLKQYQFDNEMMTTASLDEPTAIALGINVAEQNPIKKNVWPNLALASIISILMIYSAIVSLSEVYDGE